MLELTEAVDNPALVAARDAWTESGRALVSAPT